MDPDSKAAQRRIKVLRDPLWEIQPGETQVSYQRFRLYRDQDPLTRTIKRAAELSNMSHAALTDYSSKYRWVERVAAFDAYMDTRSLAAAEQAQREASRSWVARADSIRQMEYDLAMGLAEKVRDMLAYPIRRVTKSVISKDGKTTYLTIVEPARWDWKSAAEILKQIAYQARMGAEMPTDGGRMPSPDPTMSGLSDIDAWLQSISGEAEGVSSSRDEDAP